MIRRFALPAAVAAALAIACAGGLLAHPSAARAPAYALGSTLVWRVELAIVLFVALYGAIVTLRLAFHGLTITHVGARGVDIPQLETLNEEGNDVQESMSVLSTSTDELETAMARICRRVDKLEDAHDVLLHRTRGDA